MAFRWRNLILMAWFITLGTGSVMAGPLKLTVVYPKDGQGMAPVDSTFIFGSVQPGSALFINGREVKVHKGGGWLAFLRVEPGTFAFSLHAAKDDLIDTLTVTINLPELPDYTFDSLYIRPGPIQPSVPVWVRQGDDVTVSFAGTPLCNAFGVIAATGDTFPMQELPARPYYPGTNVFQAGDTPAADFPESLLVRGIYQGTFDAPEFETDSLSVIFYLYPPSIEQMAWMMTYVIQSKSPLLPLHKLSSLDAIRADTLAVPVTVFSPSRAPVVELADTLTVIRTGPGKGYLCLHQPAGIRARLAGKDGLWAKIELSPYQFGWVPDTAVTYLPPGSEVPHSFISRIRTAAGADKTTVIVATSGRHPFRVIENLDERSITIFMYNADSNTDWIRYDTNDSLIDHIVWFQEEPGVYGLKIYLETGRIWGYHTHYIDNEFHIDIKKYPEHLRELSDFRFVIDPGHSPDPGATGPTGLQEKDANLAIARRLKKELVREWAEVILTRDDDSPLPLYDRPKIAVAEKADMFISIHNNALPDGSNPFVNNGVSTLYYHPHSAALGRAVQNALVRIIGLNDFGWYYGNLAVNRPTQYPAILVECAFIMIPEQEAMLKTDTFREKISRAIVEGIGDFIRGRAETEWDRQQQESYGRE